MRKETEKGGGRRERTWKAWKVSEPLVGALMAATMPSLQWLERKSGLRTKKTTDNLEKRKKKNLPWYLAEEPDGVGILYGESGSTRRFTKIRPQKTRKNGV